MDTRLCLEPRVIPITQPAVGLIPDTDSQDWPTVVLMWPEMTLKDHSLNLNSQTAQVCL